MSERLRRLLPLNMHDRCSSHSMRRSGAMAMVNSGISLEKVSELGRWSGTETLVKNYLRDSTRLETEQAGFASVCWVL